MEWKSNKIDFNESKNFVFKSYNCFFGYGIYYGLRKCLYLVILIIV